MSGPNSTVKLQYLCEVYVSNVSFSTVEDTAVLCLSWGAHIFVTCIVSSNDMHRAFCPSSVEEACIFCLWYIFVINSPVQLSMIV